MRIKVRWPGRAGTDPRNTVTLLEDGTPWPLRFHFLLIGDDETGEREYVHVGFEIGHEFESEPGRTSTRLEEKLGPVDPVTVQRIAANYATYLDLALKALVLEREGVAAAIKRLRGPGRKSARLNDDFYRLIAADYEAHRRAGGHPGKELAAKHHADAGTVSRWVKEARRRGYVDGEEGGDNG